MVARCKAWACSRSLAGSAGSNPVMRHECLSLVSVVCCRVEVSAMGPSLDQRSPRECAVSERDFETSTRRKPRLLGLLSHEKSERCQLSGLLNYCNSWVSPWKEES